MWLCKFNQRRRLLTKVLFVLLNQLMVIGIYGKLCEVETGQNNIIVDIEESRGNGKFMPVLFLYSTTSNRGHFIEYEENLLQKYVVIGIKSLKYFFFQPLYRDSRDVTCTCNVMLSMHFPFYFFIFFISTVLYT